MLGKVWGPPDGRPALALHGWLDNAGSFDRLIPLLPKDLHIIIVDFPGHGLSDHFPPDISYNCLDAILAINRVAHHFKWDKFYLFGHSLGACFTMFYAGLYPDRVLKLINLDIVRMNVTIPETIDVRLRKTVGKLLKYEEEIVGGYEKPISYEEAVGKGIDGSFGSLNEEACEVLYKRGLKKVGEGYVFRRDRRLLAAPLSFYPKEDQLIMASKVTADVLIIKFTEGPYFEPVEDYLEHVEALKRNSKNVQYVEVEGQHHAHLTHPERIAPIISRFLGSK